MLSKLDVTDRRVVGNPYLNALQDHWVGTKPRLPDGVSLHPYFDLKLKTRFGGSTDPSTWVRKD